MLSSTIKPIEWRDQRLFLLDQRALPYTESYLEYESAESVAEAIKAMVVRGAPAIGIVAAYAVVLAAMQAQRLMGSAWHAGMEDAFTRLAAARPTAVNLHWALQRMRSCLQRNAHDEHAIDALLQEARALHEEDLQQNLAMAEAGADLLRNGARVLTHCNTGALATGGYGTALGVIRSAYADGKIETVYAGETRPWLQGARLTVWELMRDHIPVTLLCEGAVASLMRTENLHWVIVGADRIAANGDVANKIGTYALATLARHHGVGMMVVASCSTIDRNTTNGESIPIEFREAEELLSLYGRGIGSLPTAAWNPVFDITPAEYIDVLVTEKGVVYRPDRHGIAALFD